MRPTFRVGLSALIAYCGTIETSLKRNWFISCVSQTGSVARVELDGAADVAHAPVEADQALAERRLAAARLARQAHDLAVGDLERDVVERPHVAGQRAVVHLQAVDAQAHIDLSFGLKTSSSPTFIT